MCPTCGSFRQDGDTVDKLAFRWAMVRMQGKCKRECVEAVWKAKPKSVPEAIAAMRDWEHKHGPSAKVWTKRWETPQEKMEHSSWKPSKPESTPAATDAAVRVKVEKPWFQHRRVARSETTSNVTSVGSRGTCGEIVRKQL